MSKQVQLNVLSSFRRLFNSPVEILGALVEKFVKFVIFIMNVNKNEVFAGRYSCSEKYCSKLVCIACVLLKECSSGPRKPCAKRMRMKKSSQCQCLSANFASWSDCCLIV